MNNFGGAMIIRTKGGEYRAGDVSVLLDFLGIRKDAAGLQKLAGDVELITPVTFSNEREPEGRLTGSNEQGGIAGRFRLLTLTGLGSVLILRGGSFRGLRKILLFSGRIGLIFRRLGKLRGLRLMGTGFMGRLCLTIRLLIRLGGRLGKG